MNISPQFGTIVQLLPRSIMNQEKEVPIGPQQLQTVKDFCEKIKASWKEKKKEDLPPTWVLNNTDQPGETLFFIGDDAWHYWALWQNLTPEGRLQLYGNVRKQALELWV